MEILEDYKDQFGVDFGENKKTIEKVSIVRSKELKNELAGYITKFIKNEIRDKEVKEEEKAKFEELNSQEKQQTHSDTKPSETPQENITEEESPASKETQTPSDSDEKIN